MTVADVLTDVRRQLADEDEGDYRWPDATLFRYLSDAERQVKHLRPDLYLTTGDAMAVTAERTTLGDTVTLDEESRTALADLVCARALSEDAADRIDRERAAEFDSKALRALGVQQ